MAKVDVFSAGELPEKTGRTLAEHFAIHHLPDHASLETMASALPIVRGLARGAHFDIDHALIERMPKLEMIASIGVGYDGIDLKYANERGILVTNTPDVLTEEVADTALGLLIMTVRELGAAERYVRTGKWATDGNYPLTLTLRDRTVGIVGLGRIGLAIARRLDAMRLPVVYHTRHKRPDVPYQHYSDLRAMAGDVDTLVVVLPGNASTRNRIDAAVLKALGPNGIFVNIGRGMVVDEPALVAALKDGTIRAAGLDVFANEPNVPAELVAMQNVVLLPHVGSASVHTRDAMGQLLVDNLKSWFEYGKPLTAVPETPWPRK